MKITLVSLAVALVVGGCTDGAPPASAPSPTASPAAPAPPVPSDDARIYSAVVRRLVTKDHTFGRTSSAFDVVYVLDGASKSAGDPMRDLFQRPPRPFAERLVAGMRRELLGGVPPVRFVDDLDRALKDRSSVRNDGVAIALGPIERKGSDRVHVPNTLWCGGLCAQWQTYVVVRRGGRWVVTGTTGPIAIS